MKVRLILSLALLLLCTGAGAALAQTPDELPPALETICDMETGAAYGLCNAYCEAMDCDSDNPSASETACSKVKSKFTNITGRALPCEAVVCPCASIPEFMATLSNINYCLGDSEFIIVGTDPIFPGFPFSTGPIDVAGPGGCGYFSFPTTNITLPVTEEQAPVCYQLVLDAAVSRNVTCTLP